MSNKEITAQDNTEQVVVHWAASTGVAGKGSPVDKETAIAWVSKLRDDTQRFPTILYWVQPANQESEG